MPGVQELCDQLAEVIHSKSRDRSKIVAILRRLTRVRVGLWNPRVDQDRISSGNERSRYLDVPVLSVI